MLICSSLLCLLSLSFFISPAFTSSVHFSQSTSSAISVFLSLSSSVHFSQSTSSATSVFLSLSSSVHFSQSTSSAISVCLSPYLSFSLSSCLLLSFCLFHVILSCCVFSDITRAISVYP